MDFFIELTGTHNSAINKEKYLVHISDILWIQELEDSTCIVFKTYGKSSDLFTYKITVKETLVQIQGLMNNVFRNGGNIG